MLRYLNHVADRFGLRPDIQLGTTVTAAQWDGDAGQWTVTTQDGEQRTAAARRQARGSGRHAEAAGTRKRQH